MREFLCFVSKKESLKEDFHVYVWGWIFNWSWLNESLSHTLGAIKTKQSVVATSMKVPKAIILFQSTKGISRTPYTFSISCHSTNYNHFISPQAPYDVKFDTSNIWFCYKTISMHTIVINFSFVCLKFHKHARFQALFERHHQYLEEFWRKIYWNSK